MDRQIQLEFSCPSNTAQSVTNIADILKTSKSKFIYALFEYSYNLYKKEDPSVIEHIDKSINKKKAKEIENTTFL